MAAFYIDKKNLIWIISGPTTTLQKFPVWTDWPHALGQLSRALALWTSRDQSSIGLHSQPGQGTISDLGLSWCIYYFFTSWPHDPIVQRGDHQIRYFGGHTPATAVCKFTPQNTEPTLDPVLLHPSQWLQSTEFVPIGFRFRNWWFGCFKVRRVYSKEVTKNIFFDNFNDFNKYCTAIKYS